MQKRKEHGELHQSVATVEQRGGDGSGKKKGTYAVEHGAKAIAAVEAVVARRPAVALLSNRARGAAVATQAALSVNARQACDVKREAAGQER